MLYIGLSILCSVLIGNLLMMYHRNKEFNILNVFLGNYLIAAVFSLVQNHTMQIHISTFELSFGMIAGVLFLVNFLAYQANIGINGLSFSIGTMRTSVIIPAVMAFLWFGDVISPFTLIGIVLIIGVFIYLAEKGSMKNLYWLLLLFLVTGFTESTLKIFHEYGPANQSSFLIILFTSAFIMTLLIIAFKKIKLHRRSLLNGFVLGIPNQLSTLFFLWGLKTVPATVAYPMAASGIVTLGILCDVLIWKKNFSKKQIKAVLLLVVGVVLLSLKQN